MNTLFKIVFLVCVFEASAKPMTPEEGKAMFLEVLGNCKTAEGASEDDAMGILVHGIPTTKEGACLNACVMEKSGIIKGGKFDVDGAVAIAGMGGDPQKAKNLSIMGPACAPIDTADRCDLGLKIMQCLHKGAAGLGINPATDLM